MTVPLVRQWIPHEKKHKEEATRRRHTSGGIDGVRCRSKPHKWDAETEGTGRMIQIPTDNDYLFRSTRHRQESQIPTGESSWLTAPREGFTAQQDLKRQRLSNSPEGRKINGSFILGHVGGRK